MKGEIMGSDRLRAPLALLLVISTLILAIPTASAADTETVLLPWVPNGDTTGGLGPWQGHIEVQNTTNQLCSFQISVPVESGGWMTSNPFSIGPYQLSDFSPDDIGLPTPGGAVQIESTGCTLAVAVKEASGSFDQAPWSSGASEITGYTGIPGIDTENSPDWIIPIVQTNNGWDSYLRISNFDSQNTNYIKVEVYPFHNLGGSGAPIFTESTAVQSGHTQTIDLRQFLGQSGFEGFARVSSAANIAALVQREKASSGMAMINVASTYSAGEASIQDVVPSELQAPIIFNAYNGWNTGINLANPNDSIANVTIKYPESGRADDVLSIAPFSSDYVYTPSTAPNQTEFTGSAVIDSDVPVAASVDEVKYSSDDAISYVAVPAVDNTVFVPLVFKQSQDGSLTDNSGINVSNAGDTSATVEITIHDEVGNLAGNSFALTVPPHSSNFIYIPTTTVPPHTYGSAIVQAVNGLPIVAVSNDVSYDITLNGSAVFNAPSASGLYRIGAPPAQ